MLYTWERLHLDETAYFGWNMTSILSLYTEGLKKEAKAQHLEKISLLLNGIDSFVKPAQGD